MLRRAAQVVFSRLPPRARERIKQVLGAGGHADSFVNAWKAARLWEEWKRPDHLVPALREIVQEAGFPSLEGCTVMDYGSGYLLADAFVYSMFGAAEVHAVDYDRLMQPKQAREYVTRFDWNPYFEIAAQMRGESKVDVWRKRLDSALADGGQRWYERMGIKYVAPFDATLSGALGVYDLIVSRSTLEHVPVDSALHILQRLVGWVRPGGSMYHFIHLSDHRDIRGDPLAFLGKDDDYTEGQFDLRGNRMRASDWRKLFEQLGGFNFLERASCEDGGHLPAKLAEQFRGYDPNDLATTHYSVWGRVSKASMKPSAAASASSAM